MNRTGDDDERINASRAHAGRSPIEARLAERILRGQSAMASALRERNAAVAAVRENYVGETPTGPAVQFSRLPEDLYHRFGHDGQFWDEVNETLAAPAVSRARGGTR